MGFDPFSRLTDQRQTTRLVLLAIIVLTLPCYCLGAVLLATAPDTPSARSGTSRPTLSGQTASPGVTASITPFFTATPTRADFDLAPTPVQIQIPTRAPLVLPTATLTLTPTNTELPPPTAAPTLTPIPTHRSATPDGPPAADRSAASHGSAAAGGTDADADPGNALMGAAGLLKVTLRRCRLT